MSQEANTQERKTFVDIVTKDKSTPPETLKTDFAARNVLTIHLLYILDDLKVTVVRTLLCFRSIQQKIHFDEKAKIEKLGYVSIKIAIDKM